MHKIAEELFKKLEFANEPMPEFASRFPGKLESCLNQPFAAYGGVTFYRGLLKKAVALFYFCIKNHPFENGNKRFAVTITLLFLMKNGYWLNIHPVTLYEIAKAVAQTDDSPEDAIKVLYKSFKAHLEKSA